MTPPARNPAGGARARRLLAMLAAGMIVAACSTSPTPPPAIVLAPPQNPIVVPVSAPVAAQRIYEALSRCENVTGIHMHDTFGWYEIRSMGSGIGDFRSTNIKVASAPNGASIEIVLDTVIPSKIERLRKWATLGTC